MPKNCGWFKVYDRMIFSPQIIELSDSEFRLIVSLWCLASSNGGDIPYKIEGIRRLALPDKSVEEVKEMIDHLISLDLLSEEDGNYSIPRWDYHQYEYNSKTPEYQREYMKKYRAKKSVRKSEEEKNTDLEKSKEDINNDVRNCKKIDKNRIDKNREDITSYDEQNSTNGKNKSNKSYSDNAKSFLEIFRNYRENILKIPITKRDWHLKTLAVGEKLLKKYSLAEISQAIRDLGEKKEYKVLEAYHLEDFLPKWKAEKLIMEDKNGKYGKYFENDPEYEQVKEYLPWLEGTEDIPTAFIPEFLEKYRKVKHT